MFALILEIISLMLIESLTEISTPLIVIVPSVASFPSSSKNLIPFIPDSPLEIAAFVLTVETAKLLSKPYVPTSL